MPALLMLSMQHIPLANSRNVCLVAKFPLKNQLSLIFGQQSLILSVFYLLLAKQSDLHFLLDDILIVIPKAPMRSV